MKALNDRLRNSVDNSRSVPRSFPRQNIPGAHSSHHSHHHHQHQHSKQQQDNAQPTHMMFTKDSVFIPPAIPLPYEPLNQTTTSTNTTHSDTLIDLN